MAVVANKSDNYENSDVEDEEGKELAKELNAIFQRTSAKSGKGIDELFENLGKSFLEPESEKPKEDNNNTSNKNNDTNSTKTDKDIASDNFVIKKSFSQERKKKKCC